MYILRHIQYGGYHTFYLANHGTMLAIINIYDHQLPYITDIKILWRHPNHMRIYFKTTSACEPIPSVTISGYNPSVFNRDKPEVLALLKLELTTKSRMYNTLASASPNHFAL